MNYSVLILTIGAIIIVCLIIAYLMWRYKIDDRVIKLQESANSYFIKLDGRIKELESRVDSINTKFGARKI